MHASRPWKIRPGHYDRGFVLVRNGEAYTVCGCVCGSRIARIEYELRSRFFACVLCNEDQELRPDPRDESDLWAALAATMVPLPPDSLEHR